VRLHYAGVAHLTVADPGEAVRAAQTAYGRPVDRVDVIGNYTAFAQLLAAGKPVAASADAADTADTADAAVTP
jgi:hypothetical protein